MGDFDPTKIDSMAAQSLLKKIDGIKTVEEDQQISIDPIEEDPSVTSYASKIVEEDKFLQIGITDPICSVPDAACPYIYKPVECENNCKYDNLCMANAAKQSNCCPVPDESVVCTFEYDPVTCADGCVYENGCVAKAAGQDMKSCQRESDQEEKHNEDNVNEKLRLIITFVDKNEMDNVVNRIENDISEIVLGTTLLRAVGVGFVDFDPTKIDSMAAQSLLKKIDGIKTVEEDQQISIDPIEEDKFLEIGVTDPICLVPDAACPYIYQPV